MEQLAFPKPFLVISVFMLCVVASTANAQTAAWSKVPSPTNAFLESVNMVSESDGWAVGFDGTIIHWDGTAWNNVPSPTKATLKCVDMVGSTDGWAISQRTDGYGNNQSLIRWDGTSWENVTSPTEGVLNCVDMVGSTDGWAVGNAGRTIRWDGTNWSLVEGSINYSVELPSGAVEVPFNFPLESVDMISSTEGWAVGEKAVIIRWNGTNWNLERGPEFLGAPWLWSVDMVSSNDGWAVGSGGDIMRWDGTSWEYVTSPTTKHLFSVVMVNSTDGWAVGSDGCVIHWDGTSWSNVTSPTTAWLSCVDMVGSTDGWIVGADGIYRWQEEVGGFPTNYLVVVTVVVAIVVAWFFIRNKPGKLPAPVQRKTVFSSFACYSVIER